MQRITEGTEIEHPSSRDDPQDLDRNFNFYKFEENLFNDLLNRDIDDVETILNYIFHHFFTLNNENTYEERKNKYFIGRGGPDPNMWKYILERFTGAKIIHISRDPRDILASKKAKNTEKLIKSGKIFEYTETDKKAERFSTEYDDFEIYDFEDIILHTKETMDEICDFLDLNRKNIVYRPSYCGQPLKTKTPILGEINDVHSEMLNEEQKRLVDLQYHNNYKNIYQSELDEIYDFFLSYMDWKYNNQIVPTIKKIGRQYL